MTHTDLQQIQERIKFDAPAMAACLGVPYDTYRHFYYGHTKIPANVERAALELEQINATFMADRYSPGGALDRELNQLYPRGIMSEVSLPCE